MTAVGEIDSSVFVLARAEVLKIRQNFPNIFDEMEHLAIKRFKYH